MRRTGAIITLEMHACDARQMRERHAPSTAWLEATFGGRLKSYLDTHGAGGAAAVAPRLNEPLPLQGGPRFASTRSRQFATLLVRNGRPGPSLYSLAPP